MESLYEATNPDLRKFRMAGGKLTLAQGLSDSVVPAANTADYYTLAERTMGGRATTQTFFRLFEIPGMQHCACGAGADDIDYLRYLDAWVEKGQAPDVMIGAHLDSAQFLKTDDRKSPDFEAEWEKFRNDPRNLKFTRPIYPYPPRAKYKGRGDPNDAANFIPIAPHHKLEHYDEL